MIDDVWADVGATFVEHYDRLFGQVRTHVLDAHLGDHLPASPARIVDVGGGAGHQSIPLARRGYEVTIIDPSPTMLDAARAALARERADVAARVHLVEAAGEDAAATVGDNCFDGVLCHGVLMYVDDPKPLLASMCRLARGGGVISIVTETWARDRPAVDPVDAVLEVELEASRRDPYRRVSRLFHLIAERRAHR